MELLQQEQFQYVYAWLKSKFGDKQIPRFEITPQTLSSLYRLAKLNVQRDADADLLIQDASYYASEYKQQGSRMKHILQEVGVDVEQIDARAPVRVSASVLVSLASTLQLKDTQNSSYFVGINELRQESDRLEQQQQAEREFALTLVRQVMQRIAELKRVLEALESQALVAQHTSSMRAAEIAYLSSKATEYRETLASVVPVRIDRELTHEHLLGEAASLSQLKALTNHVQTVLASYMDLPPDISMAKLRIEEARAKLNMLEAELSAKLGGITDSL